MQSETLGGHGDPPAIASMDAKDTGPSMGTNLVVEYNSVDNITTSSIKSSTRLGIDKALGSGIVAKSWA